MTQTTTQSPVERTTHSHPGSLYLLPSDEEEGRRLLAQHKLHTRTLSGRLIFPPVSFSEKEDILDVGIGAATWLCDVRAQLPESVQLYGINIESRLFPSPSSNIHLSVCSGTDPPSDWSSKFALVNQRLLTCAYTRGQWHRGINEIYRVLVPGGYVQLIEPALGPESGSKTAVHVLFIDEFFADKGMLLRCGLYIPDMLKAAGFVDIKSEEAIMNLGKWAGNDGVQASEATLGGLRGMQSAVMKTGGFGRFASAEEFNKAIDEISEEWDNIEGSHLSLKVIYGRKPP